MATIYILDEYEKLDIEHDIKNAETFEELKSAVLKLLNTFPVQYS